MDKVILVNKNNSIKEEDIKDITFVEVNDIDGVFVKVEKETYDSYLKLKDFLASKDINIGISSAYRSFLHQQRVFNDFISRYGIDYASSVVAPVGTSEHHTGLALDIDIKVNGIFLSNNNDLMKYEYIYLEIHKYLSNFGFILRYPKNKENITGYSYEPWHIRYVGTKVADYIYKNDLTLEEYFDKFK